MSSVNYSEEDFRDYANGKFRGDISMMEEYLKQNPADAAQINDFRKLNNALTPGISPYLSMNLADKVVNRIAEKQFADSPVTISVFNWSLILILIIASFITFKYFDLWQIISSSIETGLFMISALGIIGFMVGFYFVEIKARKKKVYGSAGLFV